MIESARILPVNVVNASGKFDCRKRLIRQSRVTHKRLAARATAGQAGKTIFNQYHWTNVVTASDFTSRYAGRGATYGVTLGFKAC